MEGGVYLFGDAGNDTIYGGTGMDVMDGGTGSDLMVGGAGNDGYIVDSGSDLVVESVGGGTDMISSSVTFGLAANVENMQLTGTVAISGIGNGLANHIYGNNSANVIDGGDLGDTLTGNGGNDIFQFHAHEANGDAVVDFTGNGAAAGDTLVFSGYGPGATFTQMDAQNWQVNYNENGVMYHDVISFLNLPTIDPTDYSFM
jgi:Ca2+-binding RTX toxin-like protein